MTESAAPATMSKAATGWYALGPEDVAKRLDVVPRQGLSTEEAAEVLQPSFGDPGRSFGSTYLRDPLARTGSTKPDPWSSW
jgi:hypothetical protein